MSGALRQFTARQRASAPFTDDFNRATLGDDWSDTKGTFDILSNEVRGTTTTTTDQGLLLCTVERGSTDHYAEVDWTFQTDNLSWMGITVRMSTDGLSGYYGLMRATGSLVLIRKLVDGTRTDLASASTGGGAPRRVRLEAEGTDLRLYSDDVLLLSATSDPTLDGGLRTGINTHPGAGALSRGDNYEAGDL